MSCKLCKERGKTWEGSDPKCAFETGVFNQDNWNCATMNRLREIARAKGLTYINESESLGVIPFEDGYIILTWYKDRGRIGNTVIMCDSEPIKPLTEKIAIEAILYD